MRLTLLVDIHVFHSLLQLCHRNLVFIAQAHVLSLKLGQVAQVELLVDHHERTDVEREEVAQEHALGRENFITELDLLIAHVLHVDGAPVIVA